MEKYLLLMILIMLSTSCITPFEPQGATKFEGILVVEGIISNSETVITLSKTIGLAGMLDDRVYVEGAALYVECEDGSRSAPSHYIGSGKYIIETATLDTTFHYRLKLYLDNNEYQSNYLTPLVTPDFDLTWRVDDSTLKILISTSDEQEQYRHYLWSYKEDWEISSKIFIDSFFFAGRMLYNDLSTINNYYYCWKEDHSRGFIMESTENFVSNTVADKEIISFSTSDDKVCTLYHVEIKQNLIRKEAYQYYSTLQKNAEHTDIFSPIPLEITGNITCVSHPKTPVIGYIEVSTTTGQKQFISRGDAYHEVEYHCNYVYDTGYLMEIHSDWAYYYIFMNSKPRKVWMPVSCIDCTNASNGGSKQKPSFWPNDHI